MPGFLASTGTPGRDSRLRRSYCDPPGGVIVREHLQLWPRRDGLRPLALSTIMACKHVLPVMRRSNQGRLSTSRGGLGRSEAIRKMVSDNIPDSLHHGAAKHGDALLAGLMAASPRFRPPRCLTEPRA